jgi:hypothetical protein
LVWRSGLSTGEMNTEAALVIAESASKWWGSYWIISSFKELITQKWQTGEWHTFSFCCGFKISASWCWVFSSVLFDNTLSVLKQLAFVYKSIVYVCRFLDVYIEILVDPLDTVYVNMIITILTAKCRFIHISWMLVKIVIVSSIVMKLARPLCWRYLVDICMQYGKW